MDVFIVRPFGVKQEIDFDSVEKKLIGPALAGITDLSYGTTGEIVEQGNIRVDMMDRLLTADLVIADISIHNANVYYELGVRHALRHRPTILIRARVDQVPFDLKTDRYLAYEYTDLEASVAALNKTVVETLRSDKADSPVYQLLPHLDERDGADYVSTPREFTEAVAHAQASGDLAELLLLGTEARTERWHLTGERLVGRALFDANALPAAKMVFERILEKRRDDVEANLRLGTILQRLGDRIASDQALERVLASEAPAKDRSEALALQGRNLKERWLETWTHIEDPKERHRTALQSDLLIQSMDRYRLGFQEDLNEYYPGLNALANAVILTELADAQSDVWYARFPDDDEAEFRLRELRRMRDELAASVNVSLQAAERAAERKPGGDPWLVSSIADHRFLTSDRPEYVRQGYLDAAVGIKGFSAESVMRQLEIYAELGVRTSVSSAALDALRPILAKERAKAEEEKEEAKGRVRVILATGHRPDTADRTVPRFPPKRESLAREAIREAIKSEVESAEGEVVAVAGFAGGADILFHELCQEMGIKVYGGLPVPPDDFVRRALQASGGQWVERFRKLHKKVETRIVNQAADRWVSDADDDYGFRRCAMWLATRAFAWKNAEVSVIALWDGVEGEGAGNTAATVELARARGAKLVHLNTRELFDLPTGGEKPRRSPGKSTARKAKKPKKAVRRRAPAAPKKRPRK